MSRKFQVVKAHASLSSESLEKAKNCVLIVEAQFDSSLSIGAPVLRGDAAFEEKLKEAEAETERALLHIRAALAATREWPIPKELTQKKQECE